MEHTHPGPLPWSASDWSEAAMGESLRLAAESLCTFGGFGAVAISVVRDDQVVPIAVAGAESLLDADGNQRDASAILDSPFPVSLLEDTLLPVAEEWGQLRYIPHDRSSIPELGWRVATPYVGTQWHPYDLLLAPVRDATGRLRGLVSMDAPTDGLLPPPDRRASLERYAAQASRMLLTALEREELAERQRLAMAARRLLSRAADGDSPEGILAEVTDELIAAFDLAGLRASVFEGGDRRILAETSELLGRFDPELYRISRRTAESLWRHQLVALASHDQVMNFDGPADELALIRALLREAGFDSILFVPLGAGETCLGAIAFYRAQDGPRWTEAECQAAQEIGRDLGRLVSVQRALRLEREAVGELRALDDYKGRLIATVAHELKTPIAIIRANLDLTSELVADDAHAAPSLDAMGRGVDRIARIVDDLLLLAAASDPRLPARQPVDMAPYVVSGVQLAAESAARPEVLDVRTDLPDAPVVVPADPQGLERIVVNLVGNALKYSPAGGTVVVSLRDRGDHAELIVTDEGIGISAADQERIFTEFFRSADPVARRQPGTGLGLAIVDRIVAHHGGRIDVESEVGRGSTFRVFLPAF
ncbi:hypothetical protein GCM10009798_01930 [Nocardioides panacihumi]|uniref:histidine kinase n=1 Tax=Nocardioides panacihumi TaxID=400774 RepID=A0ABP5BL09_9ACTN